MDWRGQIPRSTINSRVLYQERDHKRKVVSVDPTLSSFATTAQIVLPADEREERMGDQG